MSQLEKQSLWSTSSPTIRQLLLGLCLILGTLVPSALLAQTEPANPTTTFLVVRHAERDGNLDKLTKNGEQRSQILASLGKALNVQVIYSTDTERTKGTAKPLAKTADIKIRSYKKPSNDWIASVKQNHAGEVVLIVGHSNTAGLIAGLLANEKPFEIAHDEYDALFLVQVSNSATQSMRLRYGSSSAGAPSADADKMGIIDPDPVAK